jgi:hypothetical protein
MTAGDGRGRKFTVNGRPFRPSPSDLKKTAPFRPNSGRTVDNTVVIVVVVVGGSLRNCVGL